MDTKMLKSQMLLEYEDLEKKYEKLEKKFGKLEGKILKQREDFVEIKEGLDEEIKELIAALEEKKAAIPYSELSEDELIIQLKADLTRKAVATKKLERKVKKLKKRLK